jgi:hypothetical protein
MQEIVVEQALRTIEIHFHLTSLPSFFTLLFDRTFHLTMGAGRCDAFDYSMLISHVLTPDGVSSCPLRQDGTACVAAASYALEGGEPH